MATNIQTADSKATTTYALLIVFTVDESSDEQLQDAGRIRDEAQSWLDSLNAQVRGVCVRPTD